ncbi:MAG: GlcNAc-PI de-N-acetylase [Chloroflexi bacterium]|nr:GlcNAc-PI de-N-acetylase [Chloroflexota bacterium]
MINDNQPKRILSVLAHPDDEAFGMGGTLALYAMRGVEVYLACATLGEAGDIPPDFLQSSSSSAALRESELDCSANVLALKQVFKLGFRDSGMEGSPDNHHPDALVARPMEEVVERIAAVMRQVRPQVVLTFDPVGGYFHPDHIRVHQATVLAFDRVRKELQATDPQALSRLYYHTMPKSSAKIAVFWMRLLGKDPRKIGRNKDIDLVQIASQSFPVHVKINYRQVLEQREQAAACHASQGGGKKPFGLSAWLMRILSRPVDRFMQGFPEPMPNHRMQNDLFWGMNG